MKKFTLCLEKVSHAQMEVEATSELEAWEIARNSEEIKNLDWNNEEILVTDIESEDKKANYIRGFKMSRRMFNNYFNDASIYEDKMPFPEGYIELCAIKYTDHTVLFHNDPSIEGSEEALWDKIASDVSSGFYYGDLQEYEDKMFLIYVKEIAERLDFTVDIEDYITFKKYSPERQDCFMDGLESKSCTCLKDVIDYLSEYYMNYDPCEEAVLWVDATGHGKNGAPENLVDIIKDMQWWKNEVGTLISVL